MLNVRGFPRLLLKTIQNFKCKFSPCCELSSMNQMFQNFPVRPCYVASDVEFYCTFVLIFFCNVKNNTVKIEPPFFPKIMYAEKVVRLRFCPVSFSYQNRIILFANVGCILIVLVSPLQPICFISCYRCKQWRQKNSGVILSA